MTSPRTPWTHASLAPLVESAIARQPATDLHTHVFSPAFGATPQPGGLLLFGIDELVTYHYLIAEVFRVVTPDKLPYERFWAMSKTEQADHIWKHLFVERTPLSEACRGVVTTLTKLGLDPHEKTLAPYRKFFAGMDASRYVDRVMELANVDSITMTNEVFSDAERALWLGEAGKSGRLTGDERFKAVLRIDKLIIDFPAAVPVLQSMGYDVSSDLGGAGGERTVAEGRRFLVDWVKRMKALYIACSLPPSFAFPGGGASDAVIEKMVLPACAETGIPFAMMIGSKRGVNPLLRDAGDMGAKADIFSLTNILSLAPKQRFLVTMLARDNQHELCVAARKFGNMMVFGCWWFLNNPVLIEEMTRMRMELLGSSFVPQHSDARILDQLIYKWDHSRRIIAKVLTDKYADLAASGYQVTREQIQHDAGLFLRENFRATLG